MRSPHIDYLVLYEGGPKPAGLRFVSDDFIARLEDLIDAGKREEAISTFMLEAAGVATQELEVLRRDSSWSARVAAAHTVPRELRAINDYGADIERIRTISIPVLLVVGENTEPRRREMFEQLASVFANAHIAGGAWTAARRASNGAAPACGRPARFPTRELNAEDPAYVVSKDQPCHPVFERTGSGEAMVLVHGSWGDHHNWSAIAPLLSQPFEVISFDRRSHSQSEPGRGQG